MKALSIKQPFAYLIAKGLKDIENRDWNTSFRGRFYIHASKTPIEKRWFQQVRRTCFLRGIQIPIIEDLYLGHIIGEADLVDVVTESDSEWFSGPYGFVLENAVFYKDLGKWPIPYRGNLKFFDVVLEAPEPEVEEEEKVEEKKAPTSTGIGMTVRKHGEFRPPGGA